MKKPTFKLILDGADVSEEWRKRLISLTITDEAGWTSDTLEITLSNADGKFAPPFPENIIELHLGFDGEALRDFRKFYANKITTQLAPRTVKLNCAALAKGAGSTNAATKELFKTKVTKEWSAETTLADALAEIANECGYSAKISSELASKTIPQTCLVENNETHGDFLARIAGQTDATLKAADDTLFFYTRDEAKTAFEAVEIDAKTLTAATFTVDRSKQFKSVKAKFHDADAKTYYATAGTGTPAKELDKEFSSEAEAQAAAETELAKLKRAAKTVSFSGEANLNVSADRLVKITGTGLTPELEAGEFQVGKVSFTLSAAGLQMSVSEPSR